ncbi:hypothetical protein FB45DRAFT_918330 [Roridomyces roridus]|uniref:FAD-binding PCMH-type domain-containing protein n=1 Tax=Roridomyces roridus TaxID=1738132 RepID=A0AAD7BQZ7_9AGAR|nr:hypothetical protein FB45DRAFT_918330 [Roridomyces roridus]
MSRIGALFLLLTLQQVATATSTLFPPSNASTAAAARLACHQLETTLSSSIVQTNGTEYESAATDAWNLQNTVFRPTCIVFPRVAGHVQVAMKAIFDAGSHYAVQAGGHSAMQGWNTVQDGVLIVFSEMKIASYDPVRDSITLEPGIRWVDAIAAVEAFGVAPAGGRLGDIGTGLLLGGGLSYLAASQGYSADTFMEVDVVLVNGELVTATATNKYSDLFRALKGGGNRFGIVTRYELQAIHTGTEEDSEWFGGLILYNSSAEAILNATARYTREVNDPKAALLISMSIQIIDGVGSPVYLATPFYNGPALPEDIFGEFLSIPAMVSQLGPLSYSGVAETLGLGDQRGLTQHFGASALLGDDSLFLDAFNHWTNFTTTYQDNFNSTTLAFTPITELQIQAGRNKGGNIINAPHGGFAAVQIYQTFNPGVVDIPANVQDGINLLFKQIPPSPGLPLYLNECDEEQEVFKSYGDYELMREIYVKYDPTKYNVNHMRGPLGLE